VTGRVPDAVRRRGIGREEVGLIWYLRLGLGWISAQQECEQAINRHQRRQPVHRMVADLYHELLAHGVIKKHQTQLGRNSGKTESTTCKDGSRPNCIRAAAVDDNITHIAARAIIQSQFCGITFADVRQNGAEERLHPSQGTNFVFYYYWRNFLAF